MPQRKNKLEGFDPFAIIRPEAAKFAKQNWPAVKLTDGQLSMLIVIALRPRGPGGKPRSLAMDNLTAFYLKWPDFTLAMLRFIRAKWTPKKERSEKARKSVRIQKFMLTHLDFSLDGSGPTDEELNVIQKVIQQQADCQQVIKPNLNPKEASIFRQYKQRFLRMSEATDDETSVGFENDEIAAGCRKVKTGDVVYARNQLVRRIKNGT